MSRSAPDGELAATLPAADVFALGEPPLAFDLTSIDATHQAEARTVVDLLRGPLPPDIIFEPLRIPDGARVTLTGTPGRVLRRLELELSVQLVKGLHRLLLSEGGVPLSVTVGDHASAEVALSIGRNARGVAELRTIELRFEPALRLSNSIGVARGLLPILERRFGSLDRLWKRVPTPLRILLEGAAANADDALALDLRTITLAAKTTHRGELRLEPSLSADLSLFDRMVLPLDRIPLPGALLPRIPLELDALLAFLAPLQNTTLPEGVLGPLLNNLVAMVGTAQGQFDLELSPPAFSLGYHTGEGTRRQLDLKINEPLGLKGTFSAAGTPHALQVSAPEMQVTGPRDAALIDAMLQLDFSSSGESLLNLGLERATLEVDIRPESTFSPLSVGLWQKNPLCQAHAAFDLLFEQLRFNGAFAFEITTARFAPRVVRKAHVHAMLSADSSSLDVDLGDLRVDTRIGGELDLSLGDDEGALRFAIDYAGALSHNFSGAITPLAELEIYDGALAGQARSQARLHLAPRFSARSDNATRVDLDGSHFNAKIDEFELVLDRRQLTLPAGTEVSACVMEGGLLPRRPQQQRLQLSWDLHGESAILRFEGQSAVLLAAPLRHGELTLHLDPRGKLSFSGEAGGLYDISYYNALLNPANHPKKWVDILRSDEAVRHVLDGLALFSPLWSDRLLDLRMVVLTAREIFRREGITEPRHFIPRAMMSRVFSLLLVGTDRLIEELTPIIEQVTEGKGLPLAAMKHLLQREFDDLDLDFEINVLLNWLHLVLRAGDTADIAHPMEEPPLPLSPRHRAALEELPSAAQIYAAAEDPKLVELIPRITELAPSLSSEQLEYLVQQASPEIWGKKNLQRLARVQAVKRRVWQLTNDYGGVEYVAQPYAIGAFIGEAAGPLPGVNCHDAQAAWPPPCSLGCEEVAALLKVGLAMPRQDPRTELNNRLLLELMRQHEPNFTRHVLIELGKQSPRALSGILFAFLEQDQDQMRDPIDLVALLEEKLGLEIPRHADHLAGGRRARKSYYEALNRVAERIIADANDYLARKQHLREVRHPIAAELMLRPSRVSAETRSREAIDRADALGAECSFEGRLRGPQARARKAFQRAFARCGELLATEPRAFQLPWLRAFWARNEEALRVLCTVRAYQRDLDDVRPWLHFQSGTRAFSDEQLLLRSVVENLFYRHEDHQRLLADPLTRLLIDAEAGPYDFSIVSCMGVITEGAQGRELEDTFQRLQKERGVHVVRAATGTGRSLEYNAARIIEAIESCRTPWGYIGYSQGCANALLAENLLYSGSPRKQRLLENLVGRNLLCSSANGSAHGTSAMVKFTRAMVEGERVLKHYQATHSWEAIRIALRTMRATLDAPTFLDTVGGGDSLSFERARMLHRDGQFRSDVPTSHSRAVVDEDRLPEGLEYIYYCLKEMAGGDPQDTQVLVTDAIGSATRVANNYTRAMARCDMGSPVIASHHWAPLLHEVEFVTTDRDRQLAIYDGPKDQLVLPWVETHARFGRIHRPQDR
ncbi:MAG: hypothetical protein JRH20_02925 [Deltaproteobacteria bacterium]|nr:hypothetical protein [Deltaproteobacteria bacterium]